MDIQRLQEIHNHIGNIISLMETETDPKVARQMQYLLHLMTQVLAAAAIE